MSSRTRKRRKREMKERKEENSRNSGMKRIMEFWDFWNNEVCESWRLVVKLSSCLAACGLQISISGTDIC